MLANNINTLVSIKDIPSSGRVFGQAPSGADSSFGVITRSWKRWQPELVCEIQMINVLINGQDRKYWRPVVCEDYEYFENGGWEEVGSNSTFLIKEVK